MTMLNSKFQTMVRTMLKAGSGLGIEILMELTGGTWQRDRAGGLNIARAVF
jgi:hypothetical protein